MSGKLNRRDFLKGSLAAGSAMGFVSLEEKILLAAMEKGIDVKKGKWKDKCPCLRELNSNDRNYH